MMKFVRTALRDADVLLIVTTPEEETLAHPETLEKVQKMDIPVLLLINKIDLSDQAAVAERIAHWQSSCRGPRSTRSVPCTDSIVDHLLDRIVALLPESPAFFPKDEMTDKPMRFFVSEIVREKISPTASRKSHTAARSRWRV